MRLLGDMSSIIWTNLMGGKDAESVKVQHGGRTVDVNSAEYGYEKCVNFIEGCFERFNAAPCDLVMVFEGKDSKRRRCNIDPTYKANREGDKDSRPPEAYEQFRIIRERLRETYKNLGAIAVSQDNVEGDDILQYFADNAEVPCMVLTNDGDMYALVGVNQYGCKIDTYTGGEISVNKNGDFEPKLTTLYKALVGDTSDNIKGIKGFGPAKFLQLNASYGDDGCTELMQMMRNGCRDDLAKIAFDNGGCKLLGMIVDNWEVATRCLRLTTMYSEWVDTKTQPLEWDAGMVRAEVNDSRLQRWKFREELVGAANYDKALARLKRFLPETLQVGFDIETSTKEESNDWLEAMGDPSGVDQLGQEILAGFTINFGRNGQYSYYVSVNHYDSDNVTMVQARQMIEACFSKPLIIANMGFECAVTFSNFKDEDGTMWRDHWQKYGEYGMYPNVQDIQLEASYVDENRPLGLKFRSKHHLGYDQQTYDETTILPERIYPGGREVKGKGDAPSRWQYKMHELPACHVFGYGVDDGVTSTALHNLYRLRMELEHSWQAYLQIEIDAAYQHAKNFSDGMVISMQKLKELEAEDAKVYADNWAVLRQYLMLNGWEGTVPPVYDAAITAKQIKEAYAIVTGQGVEDDEDGDAEEGVEVEIVDKPKDPFMSSRVRTPAKLAVLLKSLGHEELGVLVEACIAGTPSLLQDYVLARFDGEPKFKFSNKQMCKLLYEVMGLPIRVRGKPTAKMKLAGNFEGNPKADDLALLYARRDGTEEQGIILEAIKLIKMVSTRQSLYYSKYPYFIHWKTGKIHSSHRQCATNTRRAASAKPNLQQQPKHAKVEGYPSRFREVVRPHRRGAVVVSMDFQAQELRVIADYSQDKNMLACYVGENKKDMHALTALGILMKKDATIIRTVIAGMGERPADEDMDELRYSIFTGFEHGTPDEKRIYKLFRSLGKKVNFTTEYGAQAPKLAATMLVTEQEAQEYIDAREDAFPEAKAWKKEVIAEAREKGYVTTMMGVRRHLAEALMSEDRFISSKAERQAVNFKIQSSSAEMTKLAEGRMWRQGLFSRFDAVCYGPIHDEVVASVMIEDLEEFLPLMHACMVAKYATMQVPIESSISFGPSFGEQIEIGIAPTVEAIRAGLEEMAVEFA